VETSLHSLLRRQLRRHVGHPDTVPPEWHAFLDAVNQAYRQSDVDRLMIERSLDLSSEELGSANAHMREAVQALHGLGLRVVLDVVYNHTFASGPTSAQSVLDKIVPGELN